MKNILKILVFYLFVMLYQRVYSQDTFSFKIEEKNSSFYITKYHHLGDSIVYQQVFDKKTSILLEEFTFIGDNLNKSYKLNGIYKSYHTNGQLKTIMNYLLGVPIGIRATFHENGNIETLYDYGYNESDINLTLKEDLHISYDSVTNELLQWGFAHYKLLNGKKYVYNKEGILTHAIEYFDNKCLRVIFYDKNGNTTEKKCPKELD